MTDVRRVWTWHHLLLCHKASRSLASFGFFWSSFFLLLSLLQVGNGELWACQKRLNFVSISKDLLNNDWSIITTTIFTQPMTDGTRLGLGLFHRTVHCIVTLRCAHSFCLWSLLCKEPIAKNHVKPKFIHAIFKWYLTQWHQWHPSNFSYFDSDIDPPRTKMCSLWPSRCPPVPGNEVRFLATIHLHWGKMGYSTGLYLDMWNIRIHIILVRTYT